MPASKSYRKRKSRAKRRVAREFGATKENSTCKQRTVYQSTGLALNATKFLYGVNLTDIPRGTSINERERDVLSLKGIKVNFLFKNVFPSVSATPTDPILVNVCLLFPKDNTDILVGAPDFFKLTKTVGRAVNFNDTGNLSGMDYHTLPINSDKYGVLWHKRFKIANGSTATFYNSGSQNSWRTLNKYLKINRQVQYASATAASCNDPIFLCWWCTSIQEPTGVGTAAGQQTIGRITTFFRDPPRTK